MYHNYFENLNFNNGEKINLSNKIDTAFSETTHWHPFIEILLCLQDSAEVIINFKTYHLKTNDIVIIYPGELHSLRHASEKGFILVQFSIDLLMIMGELYNNFSMFRQQHHIKYAASNINADKMTGAIKQMSEFYYSDLSFKEVHIYSLLLEFFTKVGQYFINNKKEEVLSDNPNMENNAIELMTEACLYISKNCTKSLMLDDIANYIGFSKFHFSHLFKAYTNMTFIEFLMAERIKRAVFLISNSKSSIIEIAANSGFSSVSSFNRTFKKQKGISPSQFRKMIGQAYLDTKE
ncbi:hypothetical protein RyT2_10230 [Pseudolactococcus yaeyamensis]